METDDQLFAGGGARDRMSTGLNAPDAPVETNKPRGARFARGGPRPLTIPDQAPPVGHRSPPF